MANTYKIPLWTAILINLNIMLGAGIFLNTTVLAHRVGMLGGVSYIIIGLLMLPLVLSISHLLALYPQGGFYAYGAREISPLAGFISTWSYFVGKLGSATVMIHTAMLLLQQLIPILAHAPTFLLDIGIIILFMALNMLNLKTGSMLQNIFFGLKLIPIIFVLAVGAYFFDPVSLTAPHLPWQNIPITLSLLMYGTIGFEAAVSLSSQIKNAKKNGPRAILISYGLVILIACLYQTAFYGALTDSLMACFDLRSALPALTHLCFPSLDMWGAHITHIMYLAIAASALGGSYSILFSNSWNLFILAENKHTFFPTFVMQFNKNNIPWFCVITQGIIITFYLALTHGAQVPLQQIGALGCIIAYSISVIALLHAKKRSPKIPVSWLIPLSGTVNCILLTSLTLYSLAISGIAPIFGFGILFAFGLFMYQLSSRQHLSK